MPRSWAELKGSGHHIELCLQFASRNFKTSRIPTNITLKHFKKNKNKVQLDKPTLTFPKSGPGGQPRAAPEGAAKKIHTEEKSRVWIRVQL